MTAWHADRGVPDERIESLGADGPVLSAVLALPSRPRTAIVLRFWCDYSDEQAAEVMGCTPTTVRTHVHRGLVRLRATWTDPDTRGGPAISLAHPRGSSREH